jgi:hypothetical protein
MPTPNPNPNPNPKTATALIDCPDRKAVVASMFTSLSSIGTGWPASVLLERLRFLNRTAPGVESADDAK